MGVRRSLVGEPPYLHTWTWTIRHATLGKEVIQKTSMLIRIPISALQREGVHEEVGPITLRRCIELPLESAPEHLEQLRAAQTLV